MMRKIIIISTTLLLSSCFIPSKVVFRTSEKDAQISVDGKRMGMGETQPIKIDKEACINVRIQKPGFFTENFNYCYNGKGIKTHFVELKTDDAFSASIQTDYANKDYEVEVNSKFNEDQAWKIIGNTVTNYFDILEMADKSTGYLKTSWESKSFSRTTIRTRVIVKQSNSSPIKYRLKIVSEFSIRANASIKNDDSFREWDRILREYEGLITEFQTRLRSK